jgi:hypothetical protein
LRLNAKLVKIVRNPDFVQKLAAQRANVIGSSPERFGEHLKMETARWLKSSAMQTSKASGGFATVCLVVAGTSAEAITGTRRIASHYSRDDVFSRMIAPGHPCSFQGEQS